MSFGQKNHFVFINKKHPSFEKPHDFAVFRRKDATPTDSFLSKAKP